MYHITLSYYLIVSYLGTSVFRGKKMQIPRQAFAFSAILRVKSAAKNMEFRGKFRGKLIRQKQCFHVYFFSPTLHVYVYS